MARPPAHRWRAACLGGLAGLAAAVAVAGAAERARAAAPNGIALESRDVPGLRPAGAGRRAALRSLGPVPPRSLARAPARGAAFVRSGARLSVGVFVLGSAAEAARVLRRATHGFAPVGGIGDAAAADTRTRRGRTDAIVLLRSGRAVGAVRLEAGRRGAARPAASARAYARLLAPRIRRVLALTPWQRTIARIRPGGSVTTATALRAFTIAYGPLPGVARPRGRLGVPRSGTLAMQLVARRWAGLTPAQRAAVDRALGRSHSPGAATTVRISDQTLTPDPGTQAIANAFAAYYHARLPGAGPVPVKAFKASEAITSGSTGEQLAADAIPVNASGDWGAGPPAYCQVRVSPLGQSIAGTLAFRLLIAHEVFHCFQFALMDDWRERSAWIMEGMAEWAAVTAHPAPPGAARESYEAYLQTPDAPLFGRAYDAIGFWARVDELAGPGGLWAAVPAILDAPDDPGSFALAGGTAAAFVSTWASATFRFPAAGPAWFQKRPFAITAGQIPPPAPPVLDDAALESAPYSLRQYRVVMDAERPLVHVVGTHGALRMGSSSKDLGPAESEWLCRGSCTCPSGEASRIPPHRDVSGATVALGLSGGAGPGAGRVSFHSLDEFCGRFTDLTVTGGTVMGFRQPAFCVLTPGPGGGELRVEVAWNANGVKQGHITLTVAGYSGKGTYTIGPSGATVYDFRPASAGHLWDIPASGFITVRSPGGAFAFGANGSVSAVVRREDPPSAVKVTGVWACTRRDAAAPPGG